MYFTLVADSSVTPANIDGPELENMGQNRWLETELFIPQKPLYAFFLC